MHFSPRAGQPEGQTVLPDFTGDLAIDSWIARGAPRSRLVLGMPLYGRGWAGVPAANNGLFQTSTGGAAPGTWEAGVEDYKVLKSRVGALFTVYRDTRAGFAWLFDGSTFWTFDDPVVMRQKTAYIKRHGLGGAMVWSLDSDTPDAELVSAIHAGLR